MASVSGWQPILGEDLARQAQAVALEIADAIEDQADPDGDASLAGGAAGFALLHAYVARQTRDAEAERYALRWLGRALGGIGKLGDLSLFEGAAGVGWAGEHVSTLLGIDDVDPDGALDELLAGALEPGPWRGEYDLIGGLVGFGVYGLERVPRPAAVRSLEQIVERLEELAEHTPEGITWKTPPEQLPDWQREEAPDGYYNLGVAHGVPGVVALLGAVIEADVATARARALLDGAVSWLLANRLADDAGSAFASWLEPGKEPAPARTAWCYGDPGVAAALLVAAGADEWKRDALAIARAAARRRGEASRITDAWLCHGAAGLAHVFNRMYQATGDPVLADAARHWVERTLAMREPGVGVAGYRQPPGFEDQGDGTGFLTGAAGTALALLAAAGDVEPAWDRVLAVSARS